MTKVAPIHPELCRENVGSLDWWDRIQAMGTPLTLPLNTDKTLVSFIWRDEKEANSDIEAVYIDLYSKTPHPTQELTRFACIDNSDVWFWETELPSDWLGSYFLMPATHNQKPPVKNDRATMRRWWIQLMQSNAQHDPLNLIAPHSHGSGIKLSRVCLDKSSLFIFKNQNTPQHGQLHTTTWTSEKLKNERNIWLYQTGNNTNQKRPVILLLDGQHWANNLPIYHQLDELTLTGHLPEALYVFIDSIDASHRNTELACNPDFWNAIQQELIPRIQEQYALTPPYQNIVAGQSLGGLSAIYSALNWPEYFATAISLSGSFWWPDVDSMPGEGEFIQSVKHAPIASTPLKVVMEAGCYEKDMLKVSQLMAKALQANGHYVQFNEFRGGHDWLCWQQSLIRSLIKAFNTEFTLSKTI
ncbi:enterochelin esterase [Marinomonas rhizomae]|uniref:Enterochelin esterase family protein n=1 Tax=Marinomonas rhizomae TaxID=491948 RepID=A0A366JFL8_9GAMM|nr:enterochelin esterase [Marinomonas rhizomae]RBP85771.1 enterochelin esterase family protein [Marinomonas rhizomae]RNF75610.1 enterochelin esterase [Marinomonas rhizomae]